jgi:hypothetical protein
LPNFISIQPRNQRLPNPKDRDAPHFLRLIFIIISTSNLIAVMLREYYYYASL